MPTIYVLSKNKKNIKNFLLKIFIFYYLRKIYISHGRVFVMENQRGFRRDRLTIDMIFTARQFQKKCQERNVDLNMASVDLIKAFDIYMDTGKSW